MDYTAGEMNYVWIYNRHACVERCRLYVVKQGIENG